MKQGMKGSVLQMRKGQLQCNAQSQWSYYVYIASDKSRMMSVFNDSSASIGEAAYILLCTLYTDETKPQCEKKINTEKDEFLKAEQRNE